jgi:prepilin-type N-terminal cleavage/methylation domain-containing protein
MKKNMKNQKGFSLIELLVVVIIIGIIAAIAIPSLLSSRRAAQEASAVSAVRTISSANSVYQAGPGGGNNYATALADLGLAANGSLIDTVLASGVKGIYTYTYTSSTPASQWCLTAAPTAVADQTVYRSYAISTDGVIRTNVGNLPTGAAPTCVANVSTGGSVLGS